MLTWPENHPKARLLERKQEAIKEAARTLFLQHGYADTTMEMVAAQAGVSIMTLYRHFRGKDILFQAVIQHLCNQQAEKNAVSAGIWEGSPSEVLCRVSERRLDFFLNPAEVALYRVIIGALEHFPAVGQLYYELSFEKSLVLLSAYFQKLDREGTLRVPQPDFSARAFLALLQGQFTEKARLGAEPAPTQAEIKQHIQACVAFFLAAHRPV